MLKEFAIDRKRVVGGLTTTAGAVAVCVALCLSSAGRYDFCRSRSGRL